MPRPKFVARRTLAQRKQRVAMSANRHQEGGPGYSIEVAPQETTPDLERAYAAQATLQVALEATKGQLQASNEHSVELYKALRVERKKVTRTKAAKVNAEAHAAEAQNSLEDLVEQLEQLTLKNEQLELTMSNLLEKWAQEKQLAKDALQECRKKVSALQAQCRRTPETLRKAVEKAHQEGNKFALMEKGVYTEEARQLC
jgi:chromosome segregation ATPase